MEAKTIPCPHCKKPTVYNTENPFRPFCSERCKLIDLGEWASEKYRVPVQNKTPTEYSDPEDNNNGEV